MRSDQQLVAAGANPNELIDLSDDELRRLGLLRGMQFAPNAPRNQIVATLLNMSNATEHQGSYAPPQHQQAGPPRTLGRPHGGRKRAVLCGINYIGQREQLGGCIMDTRYMHYCLTSRYGFAESEILMLNEEQRNPYQVPTRDNIFRAAQWLLSDCGPGDSLVWMFSGHGSQVRDHSGEEIDGMNETILPVDHRRAGMIADKELYHVLIAPLPGGVKLHALCDSCHSGTILDLPYTCMPEPKQTQWQGNPWYQAQRIFKGTAGGLAVCISGCDDSQTSADTSKLSGGQATTGAMLYSFIQSLERGRARTYGELLFSMRDTISRALKGGHLDMGSLATVGLAALMGGPAMAAMVAAPMALSGFTGGVQTPQLSASECFNLNTPFSL